MTEKPPQIVKAGDEGAHLVEIWRGGVLDPGIWIEVDAVKGVGTRYVTDEYGNLVRSGDVFMAEVVTGDFEVKWLNS